MQAIKEDDDSNKDEYGIVCTQDSVVVDYKQIGSRTAYFFKQDHQMIQDSWFLLDNYSTIDTICNPHLVTDIHEVDQCCISTTNAGTGSTYLRATLNLSILTLKKEVWFDYNGIASITPLHCVQDQFKVLYSDWFGSDRNAFVVIKSSSIIPR